VNFRNLDVYQYAIRFLALALQLAERAPTGHAHLRDQLRRASTSLPLNIAEGSGKTSRADQRRFYAIARGSAMECVALLDVLRVADHPDGNRLDEADALLGSIVRMASKMAAAR